MPFTDVSGFIACLIKILCKRFNILRKRYSVPIALVLRCVNACLQARSCRAANGLTGIRVFKLYTVLGKLHQIRSCRFVYGIPALLVAEIKNYVRSQILTLVSLFYKCGNGIVKAQSRHGTNRSRKHGSYCFFITLSVELSSEKSA